jgi:hypothetical protein
MPGGLCDSQMPGMWQFNVAPNNFLFVQMLCYSQWQLRYNIVEHVGEWVLGNSASYQCITQSRVCMLGPASAGGRGAFRG